MFSVLSRWVSMEMGTLRIDHVFLGYMVYVHFGSYTRQIGLAWGFIIFAIFSALCEGGGLLPIAQTHE